MKIVRVDLFSPFANQVAKVCVLLGALLSFNLAAQTGQGGQLFGDWVVHCDTKQNTCDMSQMAVVETTSETLLRINIRHFIESDEAHIQFVLPLGVSLLRAPQLYLDNELMADIALELCLQDGCYATFKLPDQLLERFLSMQAGELKIHTGNGEPMQLPISGKGSRAAYNALRVMTERIIGTKQQ